MIMPTNITAQDNRKVTKCNLTCDQLVDNQGHYDRYICLCWLSISHPIDVQIVSLICFSILFYFYFLNFIGLNLFLNK